MLEYDLEIKPTKLVKGPRLAKLMTQSKFDCLDINFVAENSDRIEDEQLIHLKEKFTMSDWYKYVIFVLQNHRSPPELTKSKSIFVKFKSMRYCILNKCLYWKDSGGILLNCLLEYGVERVIKEFHKGDCGGHHY